MEETPKPKIREKRVVLHPRAVDMTSGPTSSTKEDPQPSRKIKLGEVHHAASMGQTRWLQISMQKAENPNQGDINGFSALHMASLHGRLDCIQMLIEKYGISVDLASLRGWRPIHLVLSKEARDMALQCLQYLVRKGADINVQNHSGVSPLHKAASEGREKCISFLIDAGADVHVKDTEGQEPLDLCIMWGHKASARRLRSAIWKIDKAHFAREIYKLNEIKLECELQKQEFLRKEQAPEGRDFAHSILKVPLIGSRADRRWMELDMCNTLAYKEWLAKKHLPAPAVRVSGLGKRCPSVNLWKYAREVVSPFPTPSITPAVTWEISDIRLPQKDWNFSTNPSSAPATSIFRPNTVRIGVDPEKVPDPDLTSFVFLQKNAFGEPEIQIDNKGKLPFVPDLPFEVLENSLYPRTTRLKVPEDLRPLHLLDLKHKRPPGPEHQWTDQMAVSLRQTVDPVFINTLKAHMSSYGDPRLLSPRLELDSSQGTETDSISSNWSSR